MDQDMVTWMADTERQQRERRRADTRLVICLSVRTALIGTGIVFFTYQDIVRSNANKARFMQQCMEDHKEYECTYLWRSSERSASDVVPIPIPIPMK